MLPGESSAGEHAGELLFPRLVQAIHFFAESTLTRVFFVCFDPALLWKVRAPDTNDSGFVFCSVRWLGMSHVSTPALDLTFLRDVI